MTLPQTVRDLPLRAQHRLALEQVLAWLPSVVQPGGMVASGSIVRGEPGPSSDLDLVVLHDQPWRRRIQRWFNGTPVELFINSPAWLAHSIQNEAAEGRPVMAHMLATGTLLWDTDGRLETLRRLSQQILQGGPCLEPAALLRNRYAAATQVEDALDFGEADTPDARQARALAVHALVQHAYLKKNQFLPRPKERLHWLMQSAPALAGLLATALEQAPVEASDALRAASRQVLDVVGFFEWDSGEDHSLPPGGS